MAWGHLSVPWKGSRSNTLVWDCIGSRLNGTIQAFIVIGSPCPPARFCVGLEGVLESRGVLDVVESFVICSGGRAVPRVNVIRICFIAENIPTCLFVELGREKSIVQVCCTDIVENLNQDLIGILL